MESDDIENAPFSFDQEVNLLCKMNENQMETINTLQKNVERLTLLNKELLENIAGLEKRCNILQSELIEAVMNKPAVCYVSCDHCREDPDKAATVSSLTKGMSDMMRSVHFNDDTKSE